MEKVINLGLVIEEILIVYLESYSKQNSNIYMVSQSGI